MSSGSILHRLPCVWNLSELKHVLKKLSLVDCEALTTASGGDCTQGYTGVLK